MKIDTSWREKFVETKNELGTAKAEVENLDFELNQLRNDLESSNA